MRMNCINLGSRAEGEKHSGELYYSNRKMRNLQGKTLLFSGPMLWTESSEMSFSSEWKP